MRGRDVVVWGSNRSYELGNGRRSNQAVPINLEGSRAMPFMLKERHLEVVDLHGKRWSKSARVEQTPVAGPGCTVVYWKIVE